MGGCESDGGCQANSQYCEPGIWVLGDDERGRRHDRRRNGCRGGVCVHETGWRMVDVGRVRNAHTERRDWKRSIWDERDDERGRRHCRRGSVSGRRQCGYKRGGVCVREAVLRMDGDVDVGQADGGRRGDRQSIRSVAVGERRREHDCNWRAEQRQRGGQGRRASVRSAARGKVDHYDHVGSPVRNASHGDGARRARGRGIHHWHWRKCGRSGS